MGASFIFGLLVASWVAGYLIYRRQRLLLAEITRAHRKIEIEETHVFDFLRGLGSAFSTETKAEDLHRLIVEGAARILNAHGGALYIANREGTALIARFTSKSCPPLIEVPPHILQQVESTPQALQSYLRLHAVEPDEGIIGAVWRAKEPVVLGVDDPRLLPLRDTSLKTQSAMVAPLNYGNQTFGVLAVANGPMSTAFTEGDLVTFKSIADQSAFALYNAIIYSQAEEKKRLDHDLQIAQQIQRILLPSKSPHMGSFEITGMSLPARQMSGDYYDYIPITENRVGVAIADVSGKGVAASLIMAMCRSVLRIVAPGEASPADALRKVNRYLFPDIKEDMFISMAYAILDDQSSAVTFCRAGHDAPLLYSAAEQTVSKLNPPGMALGIDSGDVFNRITGDFSVTIGQGDCLILYTDGVTEALDGNGLEFGIKRMIHSIQAGAPTGAAGILKCLTEDLMAFIGSQPQNDDITLIVIRKT